MGKGPISVWINSPGGDVFAAAQIYNMLMDYPYDVAVKIDGLAASAASVIAMAGTTVEMKKAVKMLDEVKESTIDNIHTVLHQVLQLAVEDNYIRQNISDNLLKELKSSHHYEDAHRRALTIPEQECVSVK